jgi:hypothetical protein
VKFAIIWERDVADSVLGLSYLDDRRGVVAASKRIVRTFDLDGEMRWRHGLPSDFRDMAPLPNGELVIACKDTLTILNSDGDEKMEMPLDIDPNQVLTGKHIILLTGNELQTFDLEGAPLGKFELDFDVKAMVQQGSGFVASGVDTVFNLDSEGKSKWKKKFDLEVTSMAAAGGEIYLAAGWKEGLPSHIKQIDVDEAVLVILEDSAVFLDLETHEQAARIDTDFSLGHTRENTAVFGSDKTVDFYEDVGDMDVYYEIMCRGEQKCGTFVSSEFMKQCPKCGASKIILRVEKKKLDERSSQ